MIAIWLEMPEYAHLIVKEPCLVGGHAELFK